MGPALDSSVGIVAYLALFASVGFAFVFVNLLIGRFVRPDNPHEEKQEIYECGEPTIGSSFVQFDLRFYVVALVFIIFDVEVAFLFPWATVFGKTTNLVQTSGALVAVDDGQLMLTPAADAIYREMGIRNPQVPGVASASAAEASIRQGAQRLAWVATIDVAIFFVVLLIAFAYEWKMGALDWVRATSPPEQSAVYRGPQRSAAPQESVLSA